LFKEDQMCRARADLIAAVCFAVMLHTAAVFGQQHNTLRSGSSADSTTKEADPTGSGGRVVRPAATRTNTYVPKHLRQAANQTPAPAAANPSPQSTQPSQTIVEGSPEFQAFGSGIGMPVEEVMDGGWFDDGTCGDCDSCGTCEIGAECCPRPRCWLDGCGGVLMNGEYFIGAQANLGLGDREFQTFEEDPCPDGFGFYGGANFGAPLNWLTCGVFSAQLGFSSVHSNLAGNDDNEVRDQRFITGGVFRRVDYGLQGGVVADYLNENWEVERHLVQIRGELGWAYPAGSSFGFRFTEEVQDYDDDTDPWLSRNVLDSYRFFFHKAHCGGGFCDLSGGWIQEGKGLMSADFEAPLSEYVALKSGFTYVFPDEGGEFDAWNVYVGISLRPRGRGWYEFYHRPLFDVANNGSMILR
jgi:hypothetical protein